MLVNVKDNQGSVIFSSEDKTLVNITRLHVWCSLVQSKLFSSVAFKETKTFIVFDSLQSQMSSDGYVALIWIKDRPKS